MSSIKPVVIILCVFLSPFLRGQSFNVPSKKESDSIFFVLKFNLEQAEKEGSLFKIANGQYALGEFYRASGIYSEAVKHYNNGLEVVKLNINDTLLYYLNTGLGKIQLTRHKYDLARQYFEEGLHIAKTLNDIKGQSIIKGLLGTCYEKEGFYDIALNFQLESLSLCEGLKDDFGIALANENLGSVFEDRGNYEQAQHYFQNAYSFLEGTGTWQEANVLNNLGDVFRKSEDYKQAIAFTRKALERARQLGDVSQLESANKDLSKVYALTQDYKKDIFISINYSQIAQVWRYRFRESLESLVL